MNLSIILVIFLVMFVVVVAIIIGLRDAAQRRAWRRIARERQINWEQRQHVAQQDLDGVFGDVDGGGLTEPEQLDERWGPEASTSESALLLMLVRIEREAQKLLDASLSRKERQLFEVRAELVTSGVWNGDDVAAFDRAMAVRNAVVHGSKITEPVSRTEVLRGLELLLAKIERASSNGGQQVFKTA